MCRGIYVDDILRSINVLSPILSTLFSQNEAKYMMIIISKHTHTHMYIYIYIQVGGVFANGQGDLSSIPSPVIPKTLKMVLDTSLLTTQQCQLRIEGKME